MYFFQLNLIFIANNQTAFCSGLLWKHQWNLRSSYWNCSVTKSVLKNFAKLTGKHPCDDHNLTSLVLKKTPLQLSLYFSVLIETGNYKLTYESQLGHAIKWGKTWITFGRFYDQLWASILGGNKIFQLLLTSAW